MPTQLRPYTPHPLPMPREQKLPLTFFAFDFDLTLTKKHTWKEQKYTNINKNGDMTPIEFFNANFIGYLIGLCCSKDFNLICCICTFQCADTVTKAMQHGGLGHILENYHNRNFFIFDRSFCESKDIQKHDKKFVLQRVFGTDNGGLLFDDDENNTAPNFDGSNIIFCKVNANQGLVPNVVGATDTPFMTCMKRLHTWFNRINIIDIDMDNEEIYQNITTHIISQQSPQITRRKTIYRQLASKERQLSFKEQAVKLQTLQSLLILNSQAFCYDK